jgi:hypothetical protein
MCCRKRVSARPNVPKEIDPKEESMKWKGWKGGMVAIVVESGGKAHCSLARLSAVP